VRVRDPFDDIDVNKRRAVLYSTAAITLIVAYSIMFPTQVALVAMIVAFFTMIMLHEFGHLLMAKRADMKVTEFFVGFGPRLWSMRKGETEYGVKAIPLGGYCKIIGMSNLEEVEPEDEPRAYRSKTWFQKVRMAFAGPATHFIIALVLMFVVLFFAGNYHDQSATTTLAGGANAPTQGAKAAGLQSGDTIVAVNGHAIDKWDEVRQYTNPNGDATAGSYVTVVVRRGDELLTKQVELQASSNTTLNKRVVLGISPHVYVPHPGFFASIAESPRQVGVYTVESVKALGHMFSPSGIANYFRILSGDKSQNTDQNGRFLSPVGFGQVANDAVQAGWISALALLITINIFVGLLNLVPLLPFDGGHIAVASYEAVASKVRRRKVQVDMAKLMPITVAVLGVFAFIFVSSLFLDITNPIKSPF
jgi:membrane-associated protease RseP (regulator of RpoE activity)